MTRVAFGCLAVLVLSASVRADVNPRWSDDQLAGFSAAIVIGRVSNLATGRDIVTGAIHTYATVAVDSVLKGDIPERVIVVKQLGGRLGDEQFVVFGQAEFVEGEDVLLFLEVRPRDRTLYTTALWQGKWTVGSDPTTGERIATRRDPDAQDRGLLRGEAERRVLSTLAARLSVLSAERAGAVRAARSFVVEPSADEMKQVVRPPQDQLPFTLLGPFRWNEFDTRTSIPVDVQASGQPGLSGGGGTELSRATGVWTGATGLLMPAGGNTNRCFGAAPFDGRVSVVFNDPCGEISNSESTIAVGGAVTTRSGGATVGGVAFSRAVAGYYVTNDAPDVLDLLRNSGCFQFVATHEFGHVLGMGHSTDTSAIMFPSVAFSTCSGGSPGAAADDFAGIRSIYPGATTSTAPGAPTGFTASSSGSTVNLAWTAPSTGGAPSGYFIEAGSAPGGANLAAFNTGNTATAFSSGGVGAGVYFGRVKATNASGTSSASNEATLVVGGACTAAPGAPTGFALTGNSGGTVSFAWTASSGSPTTYLIEAGSVAGSSNLVPGSDLGGTATTFTAPGVGRGTYFVRLRARNTCGTSVASNEVVLVVP